MILKYRPYRISFILFIVLGALIFLMNRSNINTDNEPEYAIGTIIGALIFPMIVGYGFYLFSKNKIRNSAIAFNIVLILSTFSQFGKFSTRMQEQKVLNNLYFDFDESLHQDPKMNMDEEFINFQKNIYKSFRESLNKLYKTSRDDNKQIYLTLDADLMELDIRNTEWSDAFDTYFAECNTAVDQLSDKSEIQHQKQLISDFMQATKKHRDFLILFDGRWDKLFKNRLVDNSNVENFLRGVYIVVNERIPIVVEYHNEELQLAECNILAACRT